MKDESGADRRDASFILHPSTFILLRVLGRTRVADMVIGEVLFRRRLRQTANAVMRSGALVELARGRLVVHGGPGVRDDTRPKIERPRALQSRLARHLPHL